MGIGVTGGVTRQILRGLGSAAVAATDGPVLEKDLATDCVGGDAVRFGPGGAARLLTQLRGVEAKLPGQSVYLAAIRFEFAWVVAAGASRAFFWGAIDNYTKYPYSE